MPYSINTAKTLQWCYKMTSNRQNIQQSLDNLEQINKKQQNLMEELYNKKVQRDKQHNQLKLVLNHLSTRLKTMTNQKNKLKTVNQMLREKIKRLEDEFLTSPWQSQNK